MAHLDIRKRTCRGDVSRLNFDIDDIVFLFENEEYRNAECVERNDIANLYKTTPIVLTNNRSAKVIRIFSHHIQRFIYVLNAEVVLAQTSRVSFVIQSTGVGSMVDLRSGQEYSDNIYSFKLANETNRSIAQIETLTGTNYILEGLIRSKRFSVAREIYHDLPQVKKTKNLKNHLISLLESVAEDDNSEAMDLFNEIFSTNQMRKEKKVNTSIEGMLARMEL